MCVLHSLLPVTKQNVDTYLLMDNSYSIRVFIPLWVWSKQRRMKKEVEQDMFN